MDGIHDMGGMAGFGPVDVDATAWGHEGWEARAQIVAGLPVGSVRAQIEKIPPDIYLSASYVERWLIAAETWLLDQGAIDSASLERWRATFESDADRVPPRTETPGGLAGLEERIVTTTLMHEADAPQFAVGEQVRVRRMRPEPHHRCPRYVRGVVGTVENVPGADPLPGRTSEPDTIEPIYTVKFASVDLWGDQTDVGEPPFDLLIDLWQSYLEAV